MNLSSETEPIKLPDPRSNAAGAAPDPTMPLLRISAEGEVLQTMPYWNALTGVVATAADWSLAVHIHDRERFCTALSRAIINREALISTVRLRRADSVYQSILVNLAPEDPARLDSDWLLNTPQPIEPTLAVASPGAGSGDRQADVSPNDRPTEGGESAVSTILQRQRLANRRSGLLTAMVDCGIHGVGNTAPDGQLVAQLTALLRGTDTIIPLPGNRTLVLLNALGPSIDDAAFYAGELARKIMRWLNERYCPSGGNTACGITFLDEDSSPQDLLDQASRARRRALSRGTALCYADPAIQQAALVREALVQRLSQAVESEEFVLQYQPVVSRKRRLAGAEALLRWHVKGQPGLRFPAEFLAVAAQTGIIRPLGQWVLAQACSRQAQWRSVLGYTLPISVNVSESEFRAFDFADFACDMLGRAGLASGSIQLELPASVLSSAQSSVLTSLGQLRSAGYGIIFDDYGDDGIELLGLQALPVDAIKLKAGVICHSVHEPDERGAALAAATVRVGHSLGVEVIVKSVETLEQFRMLRDSGCDAFQGRLLGEPSASPRALAKAAALMPH